MNVGGKFSGFPWDPCRPMGTCGPGGALLLDHGTCCHDHTVPIEGEKGLEEPGHGCFKGQPLEVSGHEFQIVKV